MAMRSPARGAVITHIGFLLFLSKVQMLRSRVRLNGPAARLRALHDTAIALINITIHIKFVFTQLGSRVTREVVDLRP